MAEFSMSIYESSTPEGIKHFVSCLPGEHVFARGLAPEAIVGVLLRPPKPGEDITPAIFARNRVFVDFMHDVIARRGPGAAGLVAAARRQGDGWLYVIDQRTRTPDGAVPPEDIVGGFEVRGGQLLPGSYRASPRHVILSADGFFQLGEELQACLLEELAKLE